MGQPRRVNSTTQFFSGELTEEHYWVLGWLYSDGCNTGVGASISVHENDVEVLYKIQKVMRGGKVSKCKRQRAYVFSVNSVTLSEKLAELGCVKRKSLIITYPKWITTKEGHRAFLRGVFEGDGSIYRLGHRLSAKGEIASGSRAFLEEAKVIIEEFVGIKCTIRWRINEKGHTSGRLMLGSGYQGIHSFLSFIYDTERLDLTMDRKRNAWLILRERVQNIPPKRNENINKSRQRSFFLRAPDGKIYSSNMCYGLANEYGLGNSNLARLLDKCYGFKSVKGWRLPNEEELHVAQESNSIIVKRYKTSKEAEIS